MTAYSPEKGLYAYSCILPLRKLRGNHMKNNRWFLSIAALAVLILAGCQAKTSSSVKTSAASSVTPASSVAASSSKTSSSAQTSSAKGSSAASSSISSAASSSGNGNFSGETSVARPDGGWIITFNLNYEGSASVQQAVRNGRKAKDPGRPTREGYLFNGWYSSATATSDPLTAFSFRTAISKDYTLYAGWVSTTGAHASQTYTFEAEYNASIQDMTGPGYSGTGTGKDLCIADDGTYDASNGYYVSYLYANGMALSFDIYSDKAVTNATLIWRISVEFFDATFSPANYTVSVNSAPVTYTAVAMTYDKDNHPKFVDRTITTTMSLMEGKNNVSFITNNNETYGSGTMTAHAPIIDAFKITTDAILVWSPEASNIIN
jgi:uncharacterized repeat protein (TIGR02543 family)